METLDLNGEDGPSYTSVLAGRIRAIPGQVGSPVGSEEGFLNNQASRVMAR